MNIGIVTDSNCDLDPKLIAEYDIEVIPLIVNFGEESYRDGVDLTTDEFFERISTGKDFPETSQPSPGEFIKLYQKLAADYEVLLSIHLSSGLSGTYNTAQMAAQQVDGVEIKVVDSASLSIGQGFLVLLAAELAKHKFTAEEIIDQIERAREHLKLYFTVQDLSYMEHGGRIGKASAFLGSILRLNPVLEINTATGKVDVLAKIRGENKARRKMIELAIEELKEASKAWIGLAHGDRAGALTKVENKLAAYLEGKTVNYNFFKQRINSTLGCHVGPSVYAVIVLAGDFLPDLS